MARILIVDDERTIRHTLGEFLRYEGHEVEAAEDAETALRAFRERPSDVVVSDIILPGSSGLDLARMIRAADSSVQVILMTAIPDLDNAVEAVRAGAFDFLIKPVNRSAVLRAVGNAIRLKQIADDRARLEKENRQYQENLERLVRERTAALEDEVAVRSRAEEALSRAVDRLSGLRRIDHAILEAESPRDIACAAIRHLGRVSGCRLAAVLFDLATDTATVLVSEQGSRGGGESEFRAVVREFQSATPLEGSLGSPVQDLRMLPAPSAWQQALLADGICFTMEFPLVAQGTSLGVLYLGERELGVFSGDKVEIAREVADQLSIALRESQLAEQIRAHAWELEIRVAERTAALEEANRKLQAATMAKSRFLANMSHELRTPLNGILGFSQLLLEQAGRLPIERQTRYVQNIQKSGHHLLQLINDILDLSKVEAGKITLEPAPQVLGDLLEDVLVIIRGLANKKSQRMEVRLETDLPTLVADAVRLKQICFNLLSNAVKFTPNGGRIELTARRICDSRLPMCDAKTGDPAPQTHTANRQTAMVEIAVVDSGAGIRPEDLSRLFQEFVQLETTAQQHGEGTGLGLALTRRLVELHGGTIRAESAGEGHGSTFTVRLPTGGQPTGEMKDTAVAGSPAGQKVE